MQPNKIELLSAEDRQFLMPRLDGPCYELAIALSRYTGWPMIGLILPDRIRHAGVQHPDGRFFDARGFVDEATFIQPFISPGQAYTIEEITQIDLFEEKVSLTKARTFSKLLPHLWPDLPRTEDHFMSKAIAFLEDLRALSMLHGICLKTAVPTERIHLALVKGDEQYVLAPTSDGLGLTLRRDIVP